MIEKMLTRKKRAENIVAALRRVSDAGLLTNGDMIRLEEWLTGKTFYPALVCGEQLPKGMNN